MEKFELSKQVTGLQRNLIRNLGLGLLLAVQVLVMSGCGSSFGGVEEPFEANDTRPWQALESGFSIALMDGRISFDVDYTQFDQNTFSRVDSAMTTLVAGNDFYAQEWSNLKVEMSANLDAISENFGTIAAFVDELQTYESSLGLQPQAAGCTLSATAAPTTSKRGAKAYARVSCSKRELQQKSSASSSTAKAGNTKNTDSDDGQYGSYASSYAYDTANTGDCYSKAKASQEYLALFGIAVTKSEQDTNSKCK